MKHDDLNLGTGDSDSLEDARLDIRQPVIGALATIVIGVIGFVAWAAYAPLEGGVPAQAIVSLDTKRKPIQSALTGVISHVLVREGQFVQENDVLIRLDNLAEMTALRMEEENAAAKRATMEGLREQFRNLHTKRNILADLHGRIKELVGKGYSPLIKQLELEAQLADTANAITGISTMLKQTEKEAAATHSRIEALTQQLQRTEVRAPVSGQVVGLAVQSVGAVVQPAQRLMDIIPVDEPLVVEAYVLPQNIDQVALGQSVDIHIHAFADAPMLVLQGEVQSISSDLIATSAAVPARPGEPAPQGQASFYLVRVLLTQEGEQSLGARRMQPGMSVDVMFKTGERALLSYLVQPMVRRLSTMMREE